ncbi:MAG: D-glycero-beta-D-manno-heptose 1,7-bisphosphate 7-phosphatase [Campylobacterota bacterium]|nr:D-glycero-beta-D-manno-heptose 1,7-bisphosphate 7-phosphatase [Campylobacterota bacterium]
MQSSKALFLDRDGVINVEVNYLHKKEDFVFIDGIFEVCKKYQELGYKIFVVTNQSGIARGYYSEDEFNSLSKWMVEQFSTKGITVTKVYHCPHHPDFGTTCKCRKPEPKMLLDAKKDYNIDLKNSVLIGDKSIDIEAAYNAGLRTAYLLDETLHVKESKATKIVHSLRELI